jgi:succinoglycan biosynthesis protein ExoA
VLIPALNEAAYIDACLRSVFAQEFPGELEVIVVDDNSSDGTAAIAEEAGARVVPNVGRGISAALNAALGAATGDVLLRFDAHAEMPAGHVAASLRALEEEDRAAKVGGWRAVEGRGVWGKALAEALSSPLGVGHALIWRPPGPHARRRDVEHVPLGCFRAEAVREVGGWREDLLANEDFELDHRLRLAGGRVVYDPAIWSIYRPRESLQAVARQYWRYGVWKAAVLADAPRSLRLRQVAPPALVATLAAAALPTRFAPLARAALAAYALALGVAARRSRAGWRTATVLLVVHFAWGFGLVYGIARRQISKESGRPADGAVETSEYRTST